MEHVLLDTTRMANQMVSGWHTKPMVNSHIHKESMMDTTVPQGLRLQASKKESLKTEIDGPINDLITILDINDFKF